jgi:hypothetical protein
MVAIFCGASIAGGDAMETVDEDLASGWAENEVAAVTLAGADVVTAGSEVEATGGLKGSLASCLPADC